MMGIYAILAEALRYPAPGRLETLETGLQEIPSGGAKRAFSTFVRHIQSLTLSEWEELYTRTLDLNPTTAPYIGFQIWGDSYKRGTFMARINQEMRTLGIDKDNDLPDHLVPLLRYLDAKVSSGSPASPDLNEIFRPAVQKMRKVLHKSEPDNPYLDLFDAILELPQLESNGRAQHG
jgi:nitrate reductase delta subunit